LKRLFPSQGQAGMGISDLAWSPDGTRLAFILENSKGAAGLQVLEVASGKVSCLTSPDHRAEGPSWNPGGTLLAYVSDQAGLPQIFLVGADGGQPRQLTHDAVPKRGAVWSPGGDRIAYAVQEDGRSSLLAIQPDGAGRQQLGTLAASVVSLCWAPDGRWLLLGLKQANDYQLALMDPDGICRTLADGLSGSQCPQWTRTHPRLAFSPLADSPAAHPDHAPSSPSSHS
jgi:TolB protein